MPDTLKKTFVKREYFDPTNPEHIESFKCFISTGNWGDIQFHAELPYIEVPITVLMKFALYQLKAQRETPDERDVRLAKKNLVPWDTIETRKEQRQRLSASNLKIFEQIQSIRTRVLDEEDEDS